MLEILKENCSWIFDGLGTEILVAIGSLILCGIGARILYAKYRTKQIQKAGDKAKQQQRLEIDSGAVEKDKKQAKASIRQKQTAENNSTQSQVGVIKHGK